MAAIIITNIISPTNNTQLSGGWVSQPNQRGTIDILWTCLTTLFICLWVQLHLNVPARHEGFFHQSFRRCRWLILGALVPEALLLAAGGQWASAKRSLIDMKKLDVENEWTLVHGFYADSGGFVLQAPDAPSFPISAKQLHYLVQNGYIAVPEITQKEILDKSKADKFTKTIACLQTFWFITQCIARVINHLPLSPLELQTCSIIICTMTTYFFWLHKPLNVLMPTIITMEAPIALVLTSAGDDAKEPYRYTPLDFVEPQAHILSLWPRLCRYHGPFKSPLQRMPNDRNPKLYNIYQRAYLGLNVICFSTLSFIEWYFKFPTKLEQKIWRCACVAAESSLFVHAVCESINNRSRRQMYAEYPFIEGYKLKWPIGIIFFWVPFVVYLMVRVMVIGLCIASLRSLPDGCYQTVPWSNFLPHVS
jgi:hypothetical protein